MKNYIITQSPPHSQAFVIELQHQLSWFSRFAWQIMGYFSLHDHLSQSFLINLILYICMYLSLSIPCLHLYLCTYILPFYFSRETWLIHSSRTSCSQIHSSFQFGGSHIQIPTDCCPRSLCHLTGFSQSDALFHLLHYWIFHSLCN